VQKCIKEFDWKSFLKVTKILEQKAPKKSSATLVIFLYPKIFVSAFLSSTSAAFEHHIYAVIHDNEGFRSTFK
jgi:hypothetical protein